MSDPFLTILLSVALASGLIVGHQVSDNGRKIDKCEQELNKGLHENLKWKTCEIVAVPRDKNETNRT